MLSKVGRISSASICLGGRYHSELGIQLSFSASQHNGEQDSAWIIHEFESVPYVKSASSNELASHFVQYLGSLLAQANVTSVQDLVGKPVICVFNKYGALHSWTLIKTMDG